MLILICRADGGVSVMDARPGASHADEVAKWQGTADPSWLPVASYRPVAASELPASRRFRSSWRWVQSGGGGGQPARVQEDLQAAKGQLTAEINIRKGAGAARMARVKAGIQTAQSVADLHALAQSEGWLTAVAPGPSPGEDM